MLFLVMQSLNFKEPLKANSNPIHISIPQSSQLVENKFTFGHRFHIGYNSLDPAASWFVELFDQCLETLFFYNLTNPGAPLISRLATGYHWIDNMILDVDLRKNVTFHDGSDFNASTVVWNFNRLYNIINNHSSLLEYNFRIDADPFRELENVDLTWVPEGELVDIVNSTVEVSTYKVRFNLNVPYTPFVHLLASPGTYILSPTSHIDDFDRIIDFDSETLIGTGPFRFVSHTLIDIFPIHRVTELVSNDKYHYDLNSKQYKPAYITDLTFIAYENQVELDKAIKNGEVDYAEEPSIELVGDPGLDPDMLMCTGEPASTYYFLGLSNINLELPIRKAITFALDYDYIIDEIYEGLAKRSRGPIPKGIKYYNGSIPTAGEDPINDILTARQALLNDPDYGLICTERGLDEDSTDDEWKYIAENDPIENINYTYNGQSPSPINYKIGLALKENLTNVGVNVDLFGFDFGTYWNKMINLHHELETYPSGWIPDFLDPSNYIINLFSAESLSNFAEYNNVSTQEWMYSAVSSTNMLETQDFYNKIQYQLQMETHPCAFLAQPINLNVINNSWTGMPNGTSDRRPYFYYAYEKSSGWVPGKDVYVYIEMDTPAGTDVVVSDLINDISLEFTKVDVEGTTIVAISELEPEPTEGLEVMGTYYNIDTTVAYTGNIIIGIPYDDTIFGGDEVLEAQQVYIMHYDENSQKWKKATRVDIDTLHNIVYARVSSFSIFAVMKLNYVAADIVFDPATLNLKSKGTTITVYIELLEGFDVNTIDITTILLNEQVSVESSPIEIGDYDCDGITDLMIKFDRTSVYSLLTVGEAVEIAITGNLFDENPFYGIDVIKVIDKGMSHNDENDPSSIQNPNLLPLIASFTVIITSIGIPLLNKKLIIIAGNWKFFITN
ncbi:MAG: ABC transporter substrate-binding protein [Candidatus Hodarchaeota archaeon]